MKNPVRFQSVLVSFPDSPETPARDTVLAHGARIHNLLVSDYSFEEESPPEISHLTTFEIVSTEYARRSP